MRELKDAGQSGGYQGRHPYAVWPRRRQGQGTGRYCIIWKSQGTRDPFQHSDHSQGGRERSSCGHRGTHVDFKAEGALEVESVRRP